MYFEERDTPFVTQQLEGSSKAGSINASDVRNGEGYGEELRTDN